METKRALITVDKEAWEGIQKLLKEVKISNQLFNDVLNEYLRLEYDLLKDFKQRRKMNPTLSLQEFFSQMGRPVNEFRESINSLF